MGFDRHDGGLCLVVRYSRSIGTFRSKSTCARRISVHCEQCFIETTSHRPLLSNVDRFVQSYGPDFHGLAGSGRNAYVRSDLARNADRIYPPGSNYSSVHLVNFDSDFVEVRVIGC